MENKLASFSYVGGYVPSKDDARYVRADIIRVCVWICCLLSFVSQRHIHTHAHTSSLYLRHNLSFSHTHAHSLSHCLPFSLPNTHPHSLSLSHFHRAITLIAGTDLTSLPHLTRWARHINSFTPQEIASW